MEIINQICEAWYVFVNNNVDILIMTITLIVVAGLVLEVVRLRKSINTQVVDLWEDASDTYDELCEIEEEFERQKETVENSRMDIYRILGNLLKTEDDQVKVNVHLAEDIAELQKKLKRKK